MKDYLKPELEYVDFASENITDFGDDTPDDESNQLPPEIFG